MWSKALAPSPKHQPGFGLRTQTGKRESVTLFCSSSSTFSGSASVSVGHWGEEREAGKMFLSFFIWNYTGNSLLTMIASLANTTPLAMPSLGQEPQHLLSPGNTCVSVVEGHGVTLLTFLWSERCNSNACFTSSSFSEWLTPIPYPLSLSPLLPSKASCFWFPIPSRQPSWVGYQQNSQSPVTHHHLCSKLRQTHHAKQWEFYLHQSCPSSPLISAGSSLWNFLLRSNVLKGKSSSAI